VLGARTPDYRWEGLMGFSENPPFLSGRNFSKFKNFDLASGQISRNLSGISIWPLKVGNFNRIFFFSKMP
jgi:hypothetical protein